MIDSNDTNNIHIYKSSREDFNKAQIILLNALQKNKIINTWFIIKKHRKICSKATFSRAIQKLEAMKIMENVEAEKKSRYRHRHRRLIDKLDELGFVATACLKDIKIIKTEELK